MNIPALSVDQRTIIESTFAQLMPLSDTFVHYFYNRLFELKPSVKPLFKSGIDDQGPKLVGMLAMVVKSLNYLEKLTPALVALGQRHVQYGVKREDYQVVGEALLWAIEMMLKDDCTSDIIEAWASMYGIVAEICIEASYR